MSAPRQPEPEFRVEPPFVADERTMLDAWLDFHRGTLLWKCDGLSDEELKARSAPPSTLSLLGLVRHMTEVERSWFRRRFAGEDVASAYCDDANPDGDFDLVDAAEVVADLAAYRAELDTCRAVVEGRSLDEGFQGRHWVSLRWIYVHMIEEYARHNGHADILRERIDGATGD